MEEEEEALTADERRNLVALAFYTHDGGAVFRVVRKYGGPLLNGNTEQCWHDYTLLEVACMYRLEGLVTLLLDIKETSVHRRDKWGKTAMTYIFGDRWIIQEYEGQYLDIIELFAKRDVRALNVKSSSLLERCVELRAEPYYLLRGMRLGAWECPIDSNRYYLGNGHETEVRWYRYLVRLVLNRKEVLTIMQVGARRPWKMPRELWKRVVLMLILT